METTVSPTNSLASQIVSTDFPSNCSLFHHPLISISILISGHGTASELSTLKPFPQARNVDLPSIPLLITILLFWFAIGSNDPPFSTERGWPTPSALKNVCSSSSLKSSCRNAPEH